MLTNPLQLVAVRIALYALSLIPMSALAWLAGWGVTVDGGTITISVEALIGAVFGALSLSAGVFRFWGTR
jgi:hypothetical protein